jgi:hypothetical protein
MGTYLICGVPQVYAGPVATYGPPVDPLVTKADWIADGGDPDAGGEVWAGGGERTADGQPWGGHIQQFMEVEGFPLGIGPHPPYLTSSEGGAQDFVFDEFKDPFELALDQLMPTGVTYEIIKGWGDGLPDNYRIGGFGQTSFKRNLWPVPDIGGKKFPASIGTGLNVGGEPDDAIDFGGE